MSHDMPGSGTFAMEAVARQIAGSQRVLVVRNGYFSYRWSDIFDQGFVVEEAEVLKADWKTINDLPVFSPMAIEKVVAQIMLNKPEIVFAPHVETSTGIVLTDEYITKLGAACREVGAYFVLDGIATAALIMGTSARQK